MLALLRRFVVGVGLACALAAPASAQGLPPPAAEALGQAQRAAAAALIEYTNHAPDRPLWAEALRLGRVAAGAAPNHPAPQRFLAQAYQQVGFYARAWEAWSAYREFGGTMDVVAVRHVIEVARWMGVAAYDGGRPVDAIPYFVTLVEFEPFDPVANERLARTYLEQGEALRARPHLEALDGTVPDLNDDLAYVRNLDLYGEAAALAYEAGRTATAARDPATALARYGEATGAAPGFVDAWRATVAAALALGREETAARAIDQLLALAPGDPEGLAARAALARAQAARVAAAEAEAEAAQAATEAAARAATEAAAQAAAQEAERVAAAQAAAQAAAAAEAARVAEAARAEAERVAAAEAAAAAAATEPPDAEESAAEATARAATEAAAQAAAETAAQAAAEAAAQAAADAAAQAAADAAAQAAAEAETRAAAEREAEAARLEAEAAAQREAEAQAAAAALPAEGAFLALGDARHVHRADGGANAAIAYVGAPALETDLSAYVDDVLQVRVTVVERAGDAPMWFQFCLVPPDVAVAPACSATDLLTLGGAGTYEVSLPWRTLGGASAVAWQRGVDALMWVLRRPDGTPIAGSSTDAEQYLPTSIRVQAIAVPGR